MSTTIAKRYAQALFSVTPTEERTLASAEFKLVLSVLEDPVIRHFFFHPRTQLSQKKEMVSRFSLSSTMEHFLLLVLEKSRERLLAQIEREFSALTLKAENTVLAEVISAIALKPTLVGKIKNSLERLSQKTVLLKNKVDPHIGGGLIIKIGGQIIDGSVKNSLRRFQQNLGR